jgi:hypothetical protein
VPLSSPPALRLVWLSRTPPELVDACANQDSSRVRM